LVIRGKFDPDSHNFGPGQLFDNATYIGNIRFIIFFGLAIFAGWHLDEVGRWLWHLFGEELVVSSAKEKWHRIVVVVMGGCGIIVALLHMHLVYLKRRRRPRDAQDAMHWQSIRKPEE
jgi:cytochrome bd-type quinol oxidase subunit 1